MDTTSKPAFYTSTSGPWGDYLSVLHLPYTVWHLSYVVLGASIAPTIHMDRVGWSVLAFFLATGIGAHALDELRDRPLGTRIPDWVLVGSAVISIGAAMGLGIVFGVTESTWAFLFIGFGTFFVVAYNLELFGGLFHNTYWFAAAWGAFPAITGYWANTLDLSGGPILLGLACFLLSLAQRVLSNPVRILRRSALAVEGTITLKDGTVLTVDKGKLMASPEAALQLLSLTAPVLALGLLVSRL